MWCGKCSRCHPRNFVAAVKLELDHRTACHLSAGNVDGTADVCGIGYDTGIDGDSADSANFEFSPHVAKKALSLLLENI